MRLFNLTAREFFVAGLLVVGAISCGNKNVLPSETPEIHVAPIQSEAGTRKLQKIGVQLYTLRAEMEADFEGTLRKVAALGFDEVEFAGLFGRNPADVKALLDEIGLDAVASHVNWKQFEESPDALIAETVALGADYMIVAWLPQDRRQSLAQWNDWIDQFNEVGKKAHEQGVSFAYHNHEFEFEEINGVLPFDLLLEKIDRRYVKLEMDLFWITLAGKKPAEYFEKFEHGYPLVHVKDMQLAEKKMVDVGAGEIDFSGIFAQADKSGMRHFIVEHDNPDDPFKSIENSINYLRDLTY